MLGRLLGAANSDPSFDRESFYDLKDRILERYAKPDGLDYQKISKDCWGCGGTGEYWDSEPCFKCGGDGVYEVVMVRLLRYKLGGRVFHKPDWRVAVRSVSPTMYGLVCHKRKRTCRLAGITLARIFDRHLYWKWLGAAPDSRFGWYCKRSEQVARIVARELGVKRFESIPMVAEKEREVPF